MIRITHWSGWLILFLAALALLPLPAQAQTSSPQLARLMIEVWPEFDRPEALVIYRAELAPETALPAELTFRLPGQIEAMHAVAVEQDGSLLDVNPDLIELSQEGNESLLTFPATSQNIQFEYYHPNILTKQNQTRQIKFEATVPYDIEMAILQVQEPIQSTDFSMTPAADNTFTSVDGLKYNSAELPGVTAEQTISLVASYQRQTDELSVNLMADDVEGLSGTISGPPSNDSVETATAGNLPIGHILIGAGVVLLLGTGGYWWWSNSRAKLAESSAPRRRPGRRKKQAGASGANASPKETSPVSRAPHQPSRPAKTGGYCYRCGAALRSDANFCHICGAERRAS